MNETSGTLRERGPKPASEIASTASVAVARCPSYEPQGLSRALEIALRSMGGLSSIIKSGTRVFVKINHLSPLSPPERAILTHPAFTHEVLRLLLELGAKATVGDDIHTPETDGFLKSGYRAVCSELGVRLVNLKETGFSEVKVRGEVLEKVYIARPVLEADAIVNLPKLKTHSFTIFTGAVKNMYGVIPHGLRLEYHRRFIRNDVFSRMLVDLFSCVPPQLNVMDAVLAMEGEGPSAGFPRKVGLILASKDAVALDAAASRVIGFDSHAIPTTAIAHARGLGVGDIRRVRILGPGLEEVTVSGFKHSAAAVGLFRRWLPSMLYAYLQGQLVLVPEVRPQRCEACMECLRMCPCQAISMTGDAAFIDKKNCIHCLCCHEVCHQRAIQLKQLPVGRLLRRGEAVLKRASRIRARFRSR